VVIGYFRDIFETPRGEGPRVVLRALEPADLPALRLIHEDPRPELFAHKDPWWGPAAPPDRMDLKLAAADRSLRRRGAGLVWIVADRRRGTVLGWIRLQQMVGGEGGGYQLAVRFDRAVWGRGYWSEAAGVATALAFRHVGATRVYLLVRPDNPASARGARSQGFTRLGTVTDPSGQALDRIELDAATWRRREAGADARRTRPSPLVPARRVANLVRAFRARWARRATVLWRAPAGERGRLLRQGWARLQLHRNGPVAQGGP
jgi:RimJ/RimL family protein N-acetyltransferase